MTSRIMGGVTRAAINTGKNAYKNQRKSTRSKRTNRLSTQTPRQNAGSAVMVSGRQLVDQLRRQDFIELASQFSSEQIYQRSLSGLVSDPAQRSKLLSRYDSIVASQELDNTGLERSLEYLMSDVAPQSIQLASVRKSSAKSATASLQMKHAGLTSRATVTLVH